MHWQRHKVGAAHWREMAERGETMPVVIAIGGDPASDLLGVARRCRRRSTSSSSPASSAREPVELAKAVTCDLDVPAEAEFVIEGYIDPAEALVLEGPFGDHTGFYSLADYYPQVHVTAITMRRDPIYPATLVGRPPMEDFYLGHATERIFLPLLKLTIPEIVDYHMPAAGDLPQPRVRLDRQAVSRAGVQGDERALGAGADVARQGAGHRGQGVNVRNPDEAWWVALNNIDPERDVRFTMGPMDVLDHSSRAFTYGSKMGIDATRKWPEEGFDREWPRADRDGRGDEARASTRCGRSSASRWRTGAAEHVHERAIRPYRLTARPREGQTFAGDSLLRPLRQLRQAAAHAVRAAVRARSACSRPR